MKVLAQGHISNPLDEFDWALVEVHPSTWTIPTDGLLDGGEVYTPEEVADISFWDAVILAGFHPRHVQVSMAGDFLIMIRGQREKPLWSREWPTEPGKYWFYGLSSPEHVNPSMILIDVRKDWYAVANTTIPIRKERALGLWTPAFLPNVPDLSEITEEKR